MQKFVALLRGINVGGNKKVEMGRLKKVFEQLGYSNVLTYINSGNVIFSSIVDDRKSITTKIENAIKSEFGFDVLCLLHSGEEMKNLIAYIPDVWQNNDEQKTDVFFLWKEYDKKESLDLLKKNPGIDDVRYFPGVIIWHIKRKYYSKSGIHEVIGTKLYKNSTIRNINTVRKLVDFIKE